MTKQAKDQQTCFTLHAQVQIVYRVYRILRVCTALGAMCFTYAALCSLVGDTSEASVGKHGSVSSLFLPQRANKTSNR